MNQNEFDEFSTLIAGVSEYYGKPLTPVTVQIYWNALAGLDFGVIKSLMSAHIATSRFMPTVADLLGPAQASDGRPGAEESWARLSHAIGDEGATVVLTAEERVSFFVADAIAGDKIAARMAFKEAYTKAVHEARARGIQVQWGHILGHDVAGREPVLLEAVRLGRLDSAHVAGLLPYRDEPAPAVFRMITGKP